MGKVTARCWPALGLLTAIACREPGCIEVITTVPLLEKPYPLNYPSTTPVPNQTLRSVGVGKYPITDRVVGKDFVAFELAAADGERGFVILDQNVRNCAR
jgi:hypothetical protein